MESSTEGTISILGNDGGDGDVNMQDEKGKPLHEAAAQHHQIQEEPMPGDLATPRPPVMNGCGSNTANLPKYRIEAGTPNSPEVQIVDDRKPPPIQTIQQEDQQPTTTLPSPTALSTSSGVGNHTDVPSSSLSKYRIEAGTPNSPEVQIVDDRKPPSIQTIQQEDQQPTSTLPYPTTLSTSSGVGNHTGAPSSSLSKTSTKAETLDRPEIQIVDDRKPPPIQTEQQEDQQPTTTLPSPTALSTSNGLATDTNAPISAATQPLSGSNLRRKNRIRLRRLLKNPEVTPSFLRVIGERKTIKKEPTTEAAAVDAAAANGETIDLASGDDSDDDEFLLEPPKVVIDVDVYLGLKKNQLLPEEMLSAALVASNDASFFNTVRSSSLGETLTAPVPSAAPSARISISSPRKRKIATKNPSDDGWFEGTCPMSMMPDDATYLTENQQYIRRNMEFYSASADDLAANSKGRVPPIRGRVGFRCLYCARAFQSGKCARMPPGSTSFPVDFTALYNLAIQKQQTHLENCPNMPFNMKWRNVKHAIKTEGNSSPGPRKRMKRGVSATAYWRISCRRLGIVKLQNNAGLRFGRDPKLDPLPFESTRVELEQEQPDLFPRLRHNTATVERIKPAMVLSTNAVGMTGATSAPATTPPVDPINIPKDVADVLEEAKSEKDDSTSRLVSKDDARVLSDFMFLTLHQAALCHAVREDFQTRGKKTKLMRLGFAGFCCRHCKLQYSILKNGESHGDPNKTMAARVFQNSCRSFSSSRDTLASAMSNSFVLHLMNCVYTSQRIKHALQWLKRVHSKQMHRLPYGSQSKIFLKAWEQVRAADKPVETSGVHERVALPASRVSKPKEEDEEYVPEKIGSSQAKPEMVGTRRRASLSSNSNSYPAANKDEIRKVLKDAEERWEPNRRDNLIQPEDRKLVSDFVFLTMRQLQVALPNGKEDSRWGRSRRIAGFCCIHCAGTQSLLSSGRSQGRSFPSAPDNIASILNVTIFKHLMNCSNVPIELKRTINAVRKNHNQQCSGLPYGSQRRCFEKVFAKLKSVHVGDILASIGEENAVQSDTVYLSTLQNCDFVRTISSDATYWQCSKCRMVPYDYRAPGSIFFSKPSVYSLEQHRTVCREDGIYWDTIQSSLKKVAIKYGGLALLVNRESFFNVIQSVVGSEVEVINTFMNQLRIIRKTGQQCSDRGIWRKLPLSVDFGRVQKCYSVLRKDLHLPPSSLRDSPDFLEFLRLLSCYFQIPPPKSDEDEKVELSTTLQKEATVVVPSESNVAVNGTNQELGSPDHSKNNESSAKKPQEAGGWSAPAVGIRSSSGEVSEETSASRVVMATSNDSQPTPEVDRGENSTIPKPNLPALTTTNDANKEMLLVDQRLARDQGSNVMDNIESGQFDDA